MHGLEAHWIRILHVEHSSVYLFLFSLFFLLLQVSILSVTKEIDKYKWIYQWNIIMDILRWIFLTEYAIVIFIGKHRQKYSFAIYRWNYNWKKKTVKYIDVLFLHTELPIDLNLSVIFNLWHNEWPSSLSFSHFFFFLLHSSLQQKHTPTLILSQINLLLYIQSFQHSVCQHPYSDSNFIEDSSLQQNYLFFLIWTQF